MARALFEYRYEVEEVPSLLFRDSRSILVTLHRPPLSILPSACVFSFFLFFFLNHLQEAFLSLTYFLLPFPEDAYQTCLND